MGFFCTCLAQARAWINTVLWSIPKKQTFIKAKTGWINTVLWSTLWINAFGLEKMKIFKNQEPFGSTEFWGGSLGGKFFVRIGFEINLNSNLKQENQIPQKHTYMI